MSMLSSTLKNLLSKPFTTRYPATPAELPRGNRGRVVWEMSKCIFCKRCERFCPTSAIKTDKENKTQTVVRNRCITCNTCVEVCPTQTISMETVYTKPDTAPVVHVYSAYLPDFEYVVEHLPKYGGKKEL
jgi:ech hydrogenase subunit F